MSSKNKLIKFITIPTITDDCQLCFAQYPDHMPFKIKRIYFIISPKANEPRGCHAHRKTRQVLFCIQGKVRMILDDGKNREETILSSPEKGILLEKMVWHEMHDMARSTTLIVVASEKYDPADYIRSYDQFKKLAKAKKK